MLLVSQIYIKPSQKPGQSRPGLKCIHMQMICGVSHAGSHVGLQTLKIHVGISTDSIHFVSILDIHKMFTKA